MKTYARPPSLANCKEQVRAEWRRVTGKKMDKMAEGLLLNRAATDLMLGHKFSIVKDGSFWVMKFAKRAADARPPDQPDAVRRDPENRTRLSLTGKGAAETKAELGFEVYKMRCAGASFRTIARELDISIGTAYNYVQARREEFNVKAADLCASVMTDQLEQLEDLLEVHVPRAKLGNASSADIVLKVHKRQAELLGLDSAKKVEISDGRVPLSEQEMIDRAKAAECNMLEVMSASVVSASSVPVPVPVALPVR